MSTMTGDMAQLRQQTSAQAESEPERRHIATLLTSVEREAHVSQRALADELGVALGLVNSYIKRCVKKGLIKVQQVPSRRYAYYLTPHGFAEKSRLTAEYLSWSLTFFRRARMECAGVLAEARSRGWTTVALSGGSDLAEITILSAAEQDIQIVALVDAGAQVTSVMGVATIGAAGDVRPLPDGWIVTSINSAQQDFDALVAQFGQDKVLAPPMLAISGRPDGRAA